MTPGSGFAVGTGIWMVCGIVFWVLAGDRPFLNDPEKPLSEVLFELALVLVLWPFFTLCEVIGLAERGNG